MELGAGLQDPYGSGVTPLLFAVWNGYVDVARCLVKEYKVDVDQACADLLGSPLILASLTDKLEVARWLRRLNPAYITFDGFTPLHSAIMSGQLDMMRFMLAELCADIDKVIVYAYLPEQKSTCTPLIADCRNDHLEMARYLVIELGANVHKANPCTGMPTGETPFLAASMAGDLDMMRLLATELGADVDQGGVGEPRGHALFTAAFRRQINVMRCLVEELGASIAEVNVTGDIVLLYSLRNGDMASGVYLLAHDGAILAETNNGVMTAWDLLAIYMHTRRAQIGAPMASAKDPEALSYYTALLRVMVLRGAPPPELVALLLPADRLVVQKGARLRAQLSAYLARRRVILDANCLLILPLQKLVHGYESDIPVTDHQRHLGHCA
jgi:ankyrin repeat protein